MIKNVWVMACLTAGIILCIFGNSAFAALGIIVGIAAIGFGGYFLYCFFTRRGYSLLPAIGLLVIGILLIILCVFVEQVAFFLGGIILIAAGIILLPTCSHHHRLVTPFCIGCIIMGVIMLFAASLIAWLTVFVGILLIIYSGLVLMLTY